MTLYIYRLIWCFMYSYGNRISLCDADCYGDEDDLTECLLYTSLTGSCSCSSVAGITCSKLLINHTLWSCDLLDHLSVGVIIGIVVAVLIVIAVTTLITIACCCCLIPTCPYYRGSYTRTVVVTRQLPQVVATTTANVNTTNYQPTPPAYNPNTGYQPYPPKY